MEIQQAIEIRRSIRAYGDRPVEREKLEAEGHTILVRGRKHLRYYVQDYEQALHTL